VDKVGDIKLINFYTAMEKRKIKRWMICGI
jgi:hypothetical protein